MDVQVPPGPTRGAAGRHGRSSEMTGGRPRRAAALGRIIEVLGDIDEPGVDTEIIIRKYGIPDAHGDEAVAEARRLGGAVHERDIRGRTDFRPMADRHDRRRACARLRRRDHDREAAERQLLARRAHRRRRALRPGGQRARSRKRTSAGRRSISRARRAHVSVGARDRTVQPQPARRSARAVVPDGSGSPRRRWFATRCTTA